MKQSVKRVGVREFKNSVTALIAAEETVVVEKYGKPVGVYVPLKPKDKSHPDLKEAVDSMDALMEGILGQLGMSEDEFVAEIMKDWENKESKSERETNAEDVVEVSR
ncbi:MAG: hypothetical protein U5L04_16055 [Trueperaceae bacterium]|nr:hypothetical protein [Trueperaceae bacterium]